MMQPQRLRIEDSVQVVQSTMFQHRRITGWLATALTLILFLFSIPLLLLWGFAVFDLSGRRDLSLPSKALWLVIVSFPLAGVLAYFLARPTDFEMWVPEPELSPADAVMSAPWRTGGGAAEIERLLRLRDEGRISDEEFQRLSRRPQAT